MSVDIKQAVVCVIGCGYVGLPLAQAFSKSLKVISFDIDEAKTKKLSEGNGNPNHIFTNDPRTISQADFIAICVPTPVTKSKEPDLSYVEQAAKMVGQHMKKGAIVILESTVYPGVTEEIVKPILEKESGLKCGTDFKLAYSPERINPGDNEHTVDKVTKIVAGMDEETTESVAELYRVVTPSVFKVKDIKTAEAAKLIENIQRDINIALMNELSVIFDKMGLNTKDVLDAAATKWNFHRYHPGLVGGYCIPVVPYYLVYKGKELGYHPQVILAGRAINDSMPKHVAEMTIKALNKVGKVIKGSRILIMGLTYKENVADIRESPVTEVIKELRDYETEIFGYDPLVSVIEQQLGIKAVVNLADIPPIDAVILMAAHDVFRPMTLEKLGRLMNNNPVLIDVRGFFDIHQIDKARLSYKCLYEIEIRKVFVPPAYAIAAEG